MTALTADRLTPDRTASLRQVPVAANARIFAGALIVLHSGTAKPGFVATGLTALGRAERRVDNTGGADGAKVVDVRSGTFRYAAGAGADAITASLIGGDCYVIDDQTVGATDGGGTRSRAGRIFDVDGTGVWVTIG